FRKERESAAAGGFDMKRGLLLALAAGVLSAVFNISLEYGQPIADLAARNGAGHFEGNAKLIVSTSGCFLVNFIWFTVAGYRKGTLGEFRAGKTQSGRLLLRNIAWAGLAGTLWCFQFFFYGLG